MAPRRWEAFGDLENDELELAHARGENRVEFGAGRSVLARRALLLPPCRRAPPLACFPHCTWCCGHRPAAQISDTELDTQPAGPVAGQRTSSRMSSTLALAVLLLHARGSTAPARQGGGTR